MGFGAPALIAPEGARGSVRRAKLPRGAFVMSGRRPLNQGLFRRCAGRGCGHVFGLGAEN